MRLCFVSRRYFPAISGMSVYARNLLRELVRLGHDVTMISQYRGDPVGTKIYGGGPPPPVPGVRVVGLESLGEQDGGDFERDVETMVRTIKDEHAREPFDLLHAQYAYPTGYAVLEASRRLGVPNLVSIQGGDGHWVGSCCRTHKEAMLAVLGHAGALLIGSRSFAREVEDNHGTPAGLFTIVPGAVEVERFRPRDGWEAGAFIDPETPILLYHGRVDARKGAIDLVDAFAMLVHDTKARLVVSGIGPDHAATADRVQALGLEDRVTLPGYADYDAAPMVYRRGDVFVSPTYAEGFSNTILEAMASGLPVVSCPVVGVVDCLRHDNNALLVEPGDVPSLAEALGRMLTDEALRRRLAAKALDEARSLYAWPTVARRIDGVYRRLAGTTPDTAWTPVGPPDPSCRFRPAPHLL